MGAPSANDPAAASHSTIPTDITQQTLFTDDVIALITDPSMIGVVTRTAWDSDNEADDDWADAESEDVQSNHPTHHQSNQRKRQHGDESDIDDDENDEEDDEDVDDESVDDGESDDGHLAPGHVRVLWLPPSYRSDDSQERNFSLLNELPASSCTLLDRSLLHGDVVSRASDMQFVEPSNNRSNNQSSTELGTVVDIEVDLTIRMNDRSIKHISSREVRHLHPFALGVHVFMRQTDTPSSNQFGMVEQCLCDVSVKFPDGSVCVVPSCTSGRLHDASEMCVPFETQDASDVPITYYPGQPVHARMPTWQSAIWIVGTKQSAATAELMGQVIAVQPAEVVVDWLSGMDALAPPAARSDELAVLSEFEYSKFIVGDWVYINDLKDEVDRNASNQPANQSTNQRRRPRFERPLISTDYSSACGFVVGTRTRASVEWQSGQRTDWMDSRALLPRPSVMDTEFFVNDFVLVRGSLRLACVLSVDAVQRMAKVKFLDTMSDEVERGSHELPEDGAAEREAGEIVEVPIFDLRCHPNLETASVTSMVVRIPGKNEEWDAINTMTRPTLGQAGQIIAVHEGEITVRWAEEERVVTTVRVDQVFCLDAADEENGDDEENETWDDEEEEEESEESESDTVIESNEQPTNQGQSFLSGVMNAAASVANMLGQLTLSNTSDSITQTPAPVIATDNQPTTSTNEVEIESKSPDVESTSSSNESIPVEDSDEFPDQPRSAFTFSSFRMLESASVHHHYHATQPINMSKAFIRRLNSEYASLNTSLPRGIHVAAFESRMDLLSFAVVGPINTPYYQSVFCFDVHLPQDYPSSPPQIHYHSYQMRLHPNLYAEGKVCLSLLGTWTGTESQRWNEQSTLLQLLVSVQGLILGDSSPYYLEAGYNKFKSQASSIPQSILYNEQVYGFSIAHSSQQLSQIHTILHNETINANDANFRHPFAGLIISHFADSQLINQYTTLLDSLNESINQTSDQSESRLRTLTFLKPFSIPPQNTDLPDHNHDYHLTSGFLHSLRGHFVKLVNKLSENSQVWQHQKELHNHKAD